MGVHMTHDANTNNTKNKKHTGNKKREKGGPDPAALQLAIKISGGKIRRKDNKTKFVIK